ncbi:MAG: YdcF family protein [Oscillospiraceae bacterium]|nr:YdcF family protein [Oscillospiraceae bacterium]
MNDLALENLTVLWDYMHLNHALTPADCIIGFGNYNGEIARRAAELYHQGYAPKILFTGGLGRNTDGLWTASEAEHFAEIALAEGVPAADILLEKESTNTAENILFSKRLLERSGVPVRTILGVHQPFMERRIWAAWQVYWPQVKLIVTSPRLTIPVYLENSVRQGITEQAAVEVIVGDFQRMEVYAKKGYQIPQDIPQPVREAFQVMVQLGYDGQLAPEG